MLNVALLGVAPARAQASEATYELSWVRGDGAEVCPNAEQIRDDISSRLSRDPFQRGSTKSFEILVRREPDSFVGTIYLRDSAQGTSAARELSAPGSDCDALVESLTLAVALAIDANATAAPRKVPVAPPPPPPQPAPVVCPAPPPPRFEPAPAFTGSALFSPSLLPRAQFGVAFTTELAVVPRFRLAAGASFFPESRTSRSSEDFGFALSAASLDGCLVLWRNQPSAYFCAGPRVGVIHAFVHQPEPVAPGDRLWWALSGKLTLRQPILAGVFLEAGGEAVLPMIRYRFGLTNTPGATFEQPVVAPIVYLGLGVYLD